VRESTAHRAAVADGGVGDQCGRLGEQPAVLADDRVARRVVEFLTSDPPLGTEVSATPIAVVPGWRTRPQGAAFAAARRALHAGFGREPVEIGCGGTIPFVGPFAEVMGGIPALLLGLEDPPCNAHGENESLDLGDFLSAARASAHLLAELSALRS